MLMLDGMLPPPPLTAAIEIARELWSERGDGHAWDVALASHRAAYLSFAVETLGLLVLAAEADGRC